MTTSRPVLPVDVTGEAFVLPDGAVAADAAAPEVRGLVQTRHRVPWLVVCRESNEYDSVLLQGLVEQTLAYMADRPSTALARDLGIRPLTEGSASGVTVAPLSYGRAKGVLFEIDGDYFLYAMTSAAKSNASGDNDWTRMLAAVLQALRPKVLQVVSLSRLVRSFEHSALLLHTISRDVDEVRAGSAAMRMRGEGAETGQLMWALLSMVAASERNLIVQRLTAGMVAKYRRGEWVKGLGAVPLGYRFDAKAKTLVVDPEQGEALRLAWTWMADPEVSGWQILLRLGDMGVTTRTVQKRHGAAGTVADYSDAESYLAGLRRWQHLYRTGEHVTQWANPFEGARHIAGMPVHVVDGREELHFAYDFGRPDLDPALIDAALAARDLRRDAVGERGGATRERVPGLSQVGWIQDGMEYWLAPGAAGTYVLRVRGHQEQP